MIVKKRTHKFRKNDNIIRCAQSEYDKVIFKEFFIGLIVLFLCGLHRNDALFHYTEDDCHINKKLEIPDEKRLCFIRLHIENILLMKVMKHNGSSSKFGKMERKNLLMSMFGLFVLIMQ